MAVMRIDRLVVLWRSARHGGAGAVGEKAGNERLLLNRRYNDALQLS